MAQEVYYMSAGGGKAGFVSASDYAAIGPTVGVTKAGVNDDVIISQVGNLIKTGQALRLRIRYKEGTAIKGATILCDIDKAATAIGGLRGKAYSGGTIQSASVPRRRRLG